MQTHLWLAPPTNATTLKTLAQQRGWTRTVDLPRTHTRLRQIGWQAGEGKVVYWEGHHTGTRGITVEGDDALAAGLAAELETLDAATLDVLAGAGPIGTRLGWLAQWCELALDDPPERLLARLSETAHHELELVRLATARLCLESGWPALRPLVDERRRTDPDLTDVWEIVAEQLVEPTDPT